MPDSLFPFLPGMKWQLWLQLPWLEREAQVEDGRLYREEKYLTC